MNQRGESVDEVLSGFELGQVSLVQSLGNHGGFSGARLWRIQSDVGELCLRQWPGPVAEQGPKVAWLHERLNRVRSLALPMPFPILTRAGESLVRFRNHAWELTPWLPGKANFNEEPSVEKLESVLEVLAKFHIAQGFTPETASSQGILRRREMLHGASQRVAAIRDSISGLRLGEVPIEFVELARRILPLLEDKSRQLVPILDPYLSLKWRQGVIVRDLHHDHVLYENDQVSGVVDFGSMGQDTFCFDLARLVGSLRLDGKLPWEIAIEIYSRFNPLLNEEKELMPVVHPCSVVGGCLNWLTWIFVEKRQFESLPLAYTRLQQLSKALDRVATD